MSESNHESGQLFTRKGLWICVIAAIIACAWAASDAYAGKKNKNNGNGPSDTGQANGVAHRVAALEAGLASALDMIAVLDTDLAAVEGQVAGLETQVADLELRVQALEDAAVAPVP
jgi:chromosome segregation ATPase